MSVSALLFDLRRRGVRLIADGDFLRCRGPRGALTEADLAALRGHKAEVLKELRQTAPPDALLLAGDAEPILETRSELGAVLIRSPRYGEVWVALEVDMAASLRAEEAARQTPRPVLTPADIAALAGKSEAAIETALEVFRVFGEAKVLQ